MTGRHVAAVVLWVLAGIGGLAGLGLLVWAANRQYADNQRNWGYLLGFVGVTGATCLAAIGVAVRGPRRPPPPAKRDAP